MPVRGESAKKEGHGTLYMKDVTEVCRDWLDSTEQRTVCSARRRETRCQKLFSMYDYDLISNILQKKRNKTIKSHKSGNGMIGEGKRNVESFV